MKAKQHSSGESRTVETTSGCGRVIAIAGVLLAVTCALPLSANGADLDRNGAASPGPVRADAVPDKPAKAGRHAGWVRTAERMNLSIGKSTLLRIPETIRRISLGDAAVADVVVISPRELYLVGKTAGSTNVMLWHPVGGITVFDVHVSVDADRLAARIRELIPEEDEIAVNTAAETVVLTGNVSTSEAAKHAIRIAETHAHSADRNAGTTQSVVASEGASSAGAGRGDTSGAVALPGRARVVSMLRVIPSHVLLEVRVMEVSKSLMQPMEANPGGFPDSGDWRFVIAGGPLTEALGALGTRASAMPADGNKPREWMKLLANPRVIALSGEEGGFVAGGKILVPMQRPDAKAGGATVVLDEKDFGVGLKLTPTVRRGGRISLSVSPESSTLLGRSSFVAVEGNAAGVPTLATRRTHAAFELDDGQSLVIAGWFERSPFDAIERFPALGEVPILGAMLRSDHFQAGESELVVVVTPRILRRPTLFGQTLPVGKVAQPDRRELAAGIAAHGDAPTRDAADGISHAAPSAKGGFEVK